MGSRFLPKHGACGIRGSYWDMIEVGFICSRLPPVPQACLEQPFQQNGPKMVLGHNLHHMSPFGILQAGFCMVFRPASFCFFWPGVSFLVPGTPFLVPGTTNGNQDFQIGPRLGRGGFWINNWGWKNMVLRGNGFEIGDYEIFRDQNGLYGTQEAFGKASFPQNPF